MPKIKKKDKKDYIKKMKAIRSYVDFNYDLRKELSPSQKRRVSMYFKEIDELTKRPHYIYRPRRKDHLKKAQKYSQHEKELKGLKVSFVPVAFQGEKPKIHWTKKEIMVINVENISIKAHLFDMGELVTNTEKHILKTIKTDPISKRFSLMAGKFEIPKTVGRENVVSEVLKFMTKYDNPSKNDYFGHWLHGLVGYDFKNQSDVDEYKKEKGVQIYKAANDRKNEKRRIKNIEAKIKEISEKINNSKILAVKSKLEKKKSEYKKLLRR